MQTFRVQVVPVALGAFLKLVGAARSGGEAKRRILDGEVRVNGAVEVRRGRALMAGDTVSIGDAAWRVEAGADGGA